MDKVKFCNATVVNVQANAGWEEQSSNVRIQLVEDPKDRDRFVAPTRGTPASVKIGEADYSGIVQDWQEEKSISGLTYSVSLVSPAILLDGIKVVLGSYRGQNTAIHNMLNVFGYLENGGLNFGQSLINESGIPWYLIREGILAVQEGGTDFSPGISFADNYYKVELGDLPNAPDFYRVGGLNVSLAQIISQLCRDAGHDYITYLEMVSSDDAEEDKRVMHRIRFKTRNRTVPIPYGQIKSFITGRKDIISYDSGEEFRNDITSAVLFGGDVELVLPQVDTGAGETIWPFWGYRDESPLLVPYGTQGNKPIAQSFGYGDEHTALLSAYQLADLIGDGYNAPTYPCTVLEMRFALAGYEPWAAFVARRRPDIAAKLGIDQFPSVITTDNIVGPSLHSLFTGSLGSASLYSDMYKDQYALLALQRIYEFVRGTAETFMGRSFMVRIPFLVKNYFESETNRLVSNLEPSNEGYWPDYLGGYGTGPLGLNYENFNQFSYGGKFQPFVKISSPIARNVNFLQMNPDNYLVQGDELFVRCTVEPNIVYTPAPAVVVTLAEPLFMNLVDPLGGIQYIADLLEMDLEQLRTMATDSRIGEFPIRIFPVPVRPQSASICMKSNEAKYGPWERVGNNGAVEVFEDAGLVPWNYGGYDNMQKAAENQLAEIGNSIQGEESGSVTVAAPPEHSLGDQLGGSGPVVTSIDCNMSDSGVTTSYRMRRQTPVIGAFSKSNADRLRRLGQSGQDLRRDMRAFVQSVKNYNNLLNVSARGLQARMNFLQTLGQNSYPVVQGYMYTDPDTGFVYPMVSSQTLTGSVVNSNAHSEDKFKTTASVGMEGIYRPFSTNKDAKGIAHYEKPSEDLPANALTNTKLDPYKQGNDMLHIMYGNEFKGYQQKDIEDISKVDVRSMAMRGPITVVANGYDLFGYPVPNKNEYKEVPATEGEPAHFVLQTLPQDLSKTEYLENYLKRSDMWKVGNLDFVWDRLRSVWTHSGQILWGHFVEDLEPGQEGDFATEQDELFTAFNPWSIKMPADVYMAITFDARTGQWKPLAADCVIAE